MKITLFGEVRRSLMAQWGNPALSLQWLGCSCGTDSTPGLGTSICHRCHQKEKDKWEEKHRLHFCKFLLTSGLIEDTGFCTGSVAVHCVVGVCKESRAPHRRGVGSGRSSLTASQRIVAVPLQLYPQPTNSRFFNLKAYGCISHALLQRNPSVYPALCFLVFFCEVLFFFEGCLAVPVAWTRMKPTPQQRPKPTAVTVPDP